jgi:hypothetical protein
VVLIIFQPSQIYPFIGPAEGNDDDNVAEIEEEIDPYQFIEAIDIYTKMSKTFYNDLVLSHGSRKTMLSKILI